MESNSYRKSCLSCSFLPLARHKTPGKRMPGGFCLPFLPKDRDTNSLLLISSDIGTSRARGFWEQT